MSYQLYPSDLTDREWEYIKRLIHAAKPGGRDRQTDMRLTIDAIFYINRTGWGVALLAARVTALADRLCYFRTWRITGVWERIHDRLRDMTPEQSFSPSVMGVAPGAFTPSLLPDYLHKFGRYHDTHRDRAGTS